MVKKGKPLKDGTPLSVARPWLSPNSLGGLKDADFRFLEEVVAFSDAELLAIPRVGPDTIVRLRRWQQDPNAPQPKATTKEAKEWEVKLFALYTAYLTAGQLPGDAIHAAATAVSEYERLKEDLR